MRILRGILAVVFFAMADVAEYLAQACEEGACEPTGTFGVSLSSNGHSAATITLTEE